MITPKAQFLHGPLAAVNEQIRPTVDLIFTSPPYKRSDGYELRLGQGLGRFAQRVLVPGGQLYVNFGQLLEELPRAFRFADEVEIGAQDQAHRMAAAELGQVDTSTESRRKVKQTQLVWGQTIAWVKSIATPSWRETLLETVTAAKKAGASTVSVKTLLDLLKGESRMTTRGHVTTLTSDRVLNYDWEPIFRYWKPPEPTLDRLSIGVPYTDKSNANRGTRGKNGDLRCRGDAWFVPYQTTGATTKKASAKTKHAYAFPEELVSMVLKFSNLRPGAHVLDPFCGSGTVGVVAKRMGYHFTGIDSDASAIETSREAWETA